jgi:hypothetical protein
MAKISTKLKLADEVILNRIYLVRKQKVMLDRDLAELYGVETRQLKQAVRRNLKRFPKDFMFEMNRTEFANWRSQFVMSNSDKAGLRHAPYCFTEQGVTMLSCILNSTRAIAVNIRIIRIFTRVREMLSTHKDILLQLERIEQRLSGHDDQIVQIFNYLKQLVTQPQPPRPRIGFRRKNERE